MAGNQSPCRYMIRSIIVAVADDMSIGRDNALMWHLRGDMKFFRETTTGHPVIMGRKTFESIGRALPGRLNIVISRSMEEREDLIKIGITGSYGKTSTKFALRDILSVKYNVLATPSSFNTPMGVSSVINNQLKRSHQVFIAEMGARHVGDIKEMCRLVHPSYGVLTSVGPQHLDTFHTIERIKSTKYELMDAVPQDGCCFFPDDGGICRELYDKTRKEKRLCSLKESGAADVWAEHITVSPAGSAFTLCTREESIACETRLLGEHNIQNILLAATSLGLGSCWINQLRNVCFEPPVRKLLTAYGVPEDYMVIGSVALGHIARETPAKPRREGTVSLVE